MFDFRNGFLPLNPVPVLAPMSQEPHDGPSPCDEAPELYDFVRYMMSFWEDDEVDRFTT